jgi:hypothetical protein
MQTSHHRGSGEIQRKFRITVYVLSCIRVKSWRIFLSLALVGQPIVACGPDHKPEEPCNGPTFNLVVRAEPGPLPPDTKINVHYGGNQDGEPYALGDTRTPQAVFCSEITTLGGAPSAPDPSAAGVGGAAGTSSAPVGVQALECRLYTQGPARLDVTAAGYESLEDQPLSLEHHERCEIEVEVKLALEKPDAGM